jgi:predicted aspartyl protease
MKNYLLGCLCFHYAFAIYAQKIITSAELNNQWSSRAINQYEGIYCLQTEPVDTLCMALLHDHGYYYKTIFISGNMFGNLIKGEVLGILSIRTSDIASLNLFNLITIGQKSYRHIPCRLTGYSLEMMIDDNTLTMVHNQPEQSGTNVIDSTPEYELIKILPTSSSQYELKARLNNIFDIDLLIDTGASNCQITVDLLLTLYRTGALHEDDFIDNEIFILADGSLVENERFLLREIKIGNTSIYDVETIVAFDLFAPLIIGQNALAKLGKLEFDFENHQLKIFK